MKYKIVEVEWLDHSGDSNTETPIEVVRKWELIECKSVGYVLNDLVDRLILGFNLAGADHVTGVLVIAKDLITSVTVLVEGS